MPYNVEEMKQIMSIRAGVEGIELDETAMCCLGEIGARTSLRYSVQMLTPARIIAETSGRTIITESDVKEVDELYFDGKASARLLSQSDGYMK
mmetsp:Transcript_44622/g.65649  ORF Transcript_44622/g.65649 Transcript_44622/m.65649 type:complete len:93 (-) Transcript_44622:5-283(-)